LDPLFDPGLKTVRFNKSNAARINTGFFTNSQNYNIISNICFAVNHFNSVIESVANDIILTRRLDPSLFVSMHCRFGDVYKKSSQITIDQTALSHNIVQWAVRKYPTKNISFAIMCDRKDFTLLFDSLKTAGFHIFFTDELITTKHKTILKSLHQNTDVAEFCVQKRICEFSNFFIGSFGSTVSVSCHYNMWLQKKEYELYSHATSGSFDSSELKFEKNISEKYSWKQKNTIQSHPTSWAYFSPDGLIRTICT
jgi:hypothetical protein